MIKISEMEVRKLYDRLRNESEVARHLGVSRQSMYDYRIRHEIKYDIKKAKEKTFNEKYAERNEDIISSYMSGMPLDNLCAKFSMNKPAINYILNKYKVKKPEIRKAITRNEEIYKLRMSGVSVKDIAEKYKLDPKYVSTMLYKIKRRKS